MATVLLAEDERLGRQVAVKRMHAESPDEVAQRFRREARLGAALNHPNLVAIYDIEVQEEDLLIVMEYVPGGTLKDAIARGPLEHEVAFSILRDVAAGLDSAHGHGIVHRDVKPANVLIGRDGRAKLADLGIASAADATSITRTGTVLGTAPYMAPERLDGKPGGPPADIYALAAVAYEMLSGHKARSGRSPVEIARQVMNTPPPDIREYLPDAPLAAALALQRGMARNLEDRPETAGAFVEELDNALTRGGPVAAPKDETAATAALPPSEPRDLAAYRAARALAGPAPRSTSEGPQPVRPMAEDDRPRRPRRRYQPPAPTKRRGPGPGVLGLVVLVVVGIAVGGALSANDDDSGGDSGGGTTSGQTTDQSGSTSTGGNTNTTPPEPGPVDKPEEAVKQFYELAAAGNFDAAWELAGPGLRDQLGGRASFERTFSTLESIDFTKLAIASRSDIAAVVTIATAAKHPDRTDRCTGNVQLTNDGKSGWMLQRLNIDSCDQGTPGGTAADPVPPGKGSDSGRVVVGPDGKPKKPKKPKKDESG